MHFLSTSNRDVDPSTTVSKVLEFAKQLGIVRIAEVTQLDRIGIPVFASIRPTANKKSLCVHAGKGLLIEDARASALMEAIEFAIVEAPRSHLVTFVETPHRLFTEDCNKQLLSFCPTFGVPIPNYAQIRWTLVEDLISGEEFPVPTDLVLFPLPDTPNYISYFGSSTNGLASGNNIAEATIHALLEVIERDIESFRLVKDESYLVSNNSLPLDILNISSQLEKNNLSLYCRNVPNEFGIPYFAAFILEASISAPIYASEGFGCHPNPKIALTRAVTEAAQSRLSFIHGGRDDIIERYNLFANCLPEDEINLNKRIKEHIQQGKVISFDSIPPLDIPPFPISDALRSLLNTLVRCGYTKVGRVTLSREDDPVAVVRVIVPELEALNPVTKRIGKRLAEHVKVQLT